MWGPVAVTGPHALVESSMNMFFRMAVAAVPGGLGAGLLAHLWQAQRRYQADCVPETIASCLNLGLFVLPFGPLAVTVAVWLTLWVAGVKWAGLSALLGAVIAAGGVLLEQGMHTRWTPPAVWLAMVLGAVGFAAGVLVVTAKLSPLVRVGLALVLLAPLAVFPALRKETRRVSDEKAFASLRIPLLVPQVPGYAIGWAAAFPEDDSLGMTLVREKYLISVFVIDLPDDFAPPRHCGPLVAELVLERPPDPPLETGCQQLGPDRWTRVESSGEVHLVRREGTLVLVSPLDAPAEDVAKAATTLTVLTPQRLAQLANS